MCLGVPLENGFTAILVCLGEEAHLEQQTRSQIGYAWRREEGQASSLVELSKTVGRLPVFLKEGCGLLTNFKLL